MTVLRGIFKTTPTAMLDSQQREFRLDNFGALVVNTANADGTYAPGGGATDPLSMQPRGVSSFATAQAATSISPAAANQLVAARATRSAVTITNITGTQPIYFLATNGTTGLTTGDFIPATVGASKTIPTTAAVFGTSPTAAQAVSILETF